MKAAEVSNTNAGAATFECVGVVVSTEVSAVLWVQVQVQTPEVMCVNLHITSHSPVPPCEGFAGVE